MKKLSIDIYTFDELSEEAQIYVVENNRDINVDGDWWYEDELTYEKEQLEDLGFSDVEINFSGFWSQGDGASFTANDIDLEKFILSQKWGKEYQALLYAIRHDEVYPMCYVRRIDHGYSHENTVRAELGIDIYIEDDDRVKKVEGQIEDLEREITQFVRNKSRMIYRNLQKVYDYMVSDEAVVDFFTNNEIYFTKEGESKIYIGAYEQEEG